MDAPLVEVTDECIRVTGELTIARAEETRVALVEALASAGKLAKLDLSGVSEMDTSGLQLLMAADRELLGRGGTLQVVAASAAVRGTLELFRQHRLFAGDGVQP